MKLKGVLLGILIFLGVAVRWVQYTSDRPLWVDEAMLTVNILNRSYRELLTPLDYEQQAPIGFLLVTKWFTQMFGIGEIVLRFVPFVVSIGSLVCVSILSRMLLPYMFSLISLLLFIFSAPLIYYASEVKPYALDLTIGLVLTLLALRKSSLLWLFLIGFVGLWFSQAIVFILAAIGIDAVVKAFQKKDWHKLYVWLGMGMGWLTSFGLQSMLTLGEYYARFRGVWKNYYAPFPPVNIEDVSWYIQTAIETIRRPGGISLWPIGIGAFCVGVWYLVYRKKDWFIVLLLPGFLALVASMFHYYPFHGRFLLFFTPALLLCIVAGLWQFFDWAWKSKWITMKIISVAVLGAIVWNSLQIGVYRLRNPERFEVITPLIRYYVDKRQPDDVLYLYYGAAFAFDYYAQRFAIDPGVYVKGVERTSDVSQYQNDLRKLDGKLRVWVMFSHIYNWAGIDEEAYFVQQLGLMGQKIDEVRTDGASLYLYDLSGSP